MSDPTWGQGIWSSSGSGAFQSTNWDSTAPDVVTSSWAFQTDDVLTTEPLEEEMAASHAVGATYGVASGNFYLDRPMGLRFHRHMTDEEVGLTLRSRSTTGRMLAP